MAFEPDRVVIELIAKNEQFDSSMKKSASTNEAAMNKIVSDAGKAEGAVTRGLSNQGKAFEREAKQITQTSQRMTAGFVDMSKVLTGPSSPFVVPVKQAPIANAAMRAVAAGAGILGGIMGGIVVASATAAAAALLEMALGAETAEDKIAALAEKLKEQAENTRLAAQAQDIYDRSIEGSIAKIEKLTQALEEQNRTLEDNINLSKTAGSGALTNVVNNISGVSKELSEAVEAYQRAKQAYAQAESGGNAGSGLDAANNVLNARREMQAAEQRVISLSGSLEDLSTAANGGARALRAVNFPLFEREAREAHDPIAAINRLYDDMAKRAKTAGTFTRELARSIEDTRNAALKAERDRQAAARSSSSGLSGNKVSFAEAQAIAERAGFQVNSAERSYAEQARLYNDPKVNRPDNPVAKPGTSAHEGVRGKWALDIQFAPGLTPAKIRKTFGDEGVSLTALYKEKGHYHVEGNTGERGGTGPSAETLARRALAEAQREANERAAFAGERASLQDAELEARQLLANTAEEVAELELQSIEISRQRYEGNVRHLEASGRLLKEEADELVKLNNTRAELRVELVKRREEQRKFRMREAELERGIRTGAALMGAEADLLESRQSVARTANERRELERRLLELQFREERMLLEASIQRAARLRAEADRTKSQEIMAAADAAEAEAAVARAQLNSLPEREANATANSERANASPLQSYFGDIQAQADDLNTAFEQIAAGGLNTFVDRLTDAIVNFRSLADVGRAVLAGLTADLVKLALRMIINATIGKAITAASSAAQAAQLAAIGAAAAGPAALVATATAGGASVAANIGLASTAALAQTIAMPKPFADGGRIYGPGGDRSDSVPIRASRDEFVLRASSARSVGYDVLEHINRTGALPAAFAFGGRVNPSNMRASSSRGGGFGAGAIGELRGIIGEAVSAGIAAMPDVSLYASLDPVDVLQKALGSPAGERVLVAALGRNSSRVRATVG